MSNEEGSPNSERREQTPYYEFTRQEFVANLDKILGSIVPTEFNLGSEDEVGDIRFRLFYLPDDPIKREKRLAEIRQKGTDRTDPTLRSRHHIIYVRAAQRANISQLDVFDVMNTIDFRRNVQTLLNPSEQSHWGVNAISIYDAKTEQGIKSVFGVDHTFKDLSNRDKALLAIIGLK